MVVVVGGGSQALAGVRVMRRTAGSSARGRSRRSSCRWPWRENATPGLFEAETGRRTVVVLATDVPPEFLAGSEVHVSPLTRVGETHGFNS